MSKISLVNNDLIIFCLILGPITFVVANNLTNYPPSTFLIPIYLSALIFFTILTMQKILKKKIFKDIIYLFSLIWFFSFFYSDLGNYFNNNFFFKIIILIFLIFIFYFYRKNNFLKTFIIFFFIINLSISFLNYLFHTDKDFKINENESLFKDNNFKNLNIKYQNIYFVILDGMSSLAYLDKYTEINNKKAFNENINQLKKKGITIFDKSYSSYTTTHLSLASFLYLGFPVNEESDRYKNRGMFFPQMLEKDSGSLPLISFLEQINYNFYHVGNRWSQCHNKPPVKCIEYDEKSILYKILNDYGFTVFIKKNPIYRFIPKLRLNTRLKHKVKANLHSLLPFAETLKQTNEYNGSNNFFFIHSLTPHSPYTDEDCNYLKNSENNDQEGYETSIICALKTANLFFETIQQFDKNSIIIFTSDHGGEVEFDFYKNYEDLSQKDIEQRLSIFNSIYAPNCELIKKLTNPSNLDVLAVSLSCVTNKSFDIPKKNYLGFYEKSDEFGKVYDLSKSLIHNEN